MPTKKQKQKAANKKYYDEHKAVVRSNQVTYYAQNKTEGKSICSSYKCEMNCNIDNNVKCVVMLSQNKEKGYVWIY